MRFALAAILFIGVAFINPSTAFAQADTNPATSADTDDGGTVVPGVAAPSTGLETLTKAEFAEMLQEALVAGMVQVAAQQAPNPAPAPVPAPDLSAANLAAIQAHAEAMKVPTFASCSDLVNGEISGDEGCVIMSEYDLTVVADDVEKVKDYIATWSSTKARLYSRKLLTFKRRDFCASWDFAHGLDCSTFSFRQMHEYNDNRPMLEATTAIEHLRRDVDRLMGKRKAAGKKKAKGTIKATPAKKGKTPGKKGCTSCGLEKASLKPANPAAPVPAPAPPVE